MAAKDITADLDSRRSFAKWPPPRWQAVHAQRLWAVRAYRMVTAADLALLLPKIAAPAIDDLQSDPGKHELNNPHPQLTDRQVEILALIAKAMHVDAVWLCGGDQPCPHYGISEALRYAAWFNLERQAEDAEGRPDRPSTVHLNWLWIEEVEDAWLRMLTNPRETRLISRLEMAVKDPTPLPTTYRDQLLADPVYPSTKLKPLRHWLETDALVHLAKHLLPLVKAPQPSQISGTLAAIDAMGAKAQAGDASAEWRQLFGPPPPALPVGPTSIDEDIVKPLRSIVQTRREAADLAMEDKALRQSLPKLQKDVARAETGMKAVHNAIHGEGSYAKAFDALREARTLPDPSNAQRAHPTEDDLSFRSFYCLFVTRFPKETPVNLLEAVRQFRLLRSEMLAPDHDVTPNWGETLSLFNRCEGRLVQAKALREALGKLTGIDPEPMTKALITQGRILDRPGQNKSDHYLLILDADDRAGWSNRPKDETPKVKAVGVMLQTAAPAPTATEEVPVKTKPATPPPPAPPAEAVPTAREPSPLAAMPTTSAVDKVRSGSLPTKPATAKRTKPSATASKPTKPPRSTARSRSLPTALAKAKKPSPTAKGKAVSKKPLASGRVKPSRAEKNTSIGRRARRSR